MKIFNVLFLFTIVLFRCGSQAKSLVEGMKTERELQQEEIASQEPLFENARFPLGYAEANGYSKIGSLYDMPNYRAEIMKRSLRNHNPRQRQTGIIYGGGKPIGILQPYQESFKFMPIKEERMFALDGGRSGFDQQEPYINLMYPVSRFTRNDDAVRAAEAEAAKAEFLDKHYPSMLVDFKIHNKLHPSGYDAKTMQSYNLNRDEATHSNSNNEFKKKKREKQSSISSNQKLHKRESPHVQKRESGSNKQSKTTVTIQKRDDKKVNKREEITNPGPQKREVDTVLQTASKKTKKKRQSKLTDSQFEILKNSIAKRNANGHIQFMEEDLRGLLSDMGLIEDDLQENAEEMEERKRQVVQDEDLEEGFDTTVQKDKEQPQVKQKREDKVVQKRGEKSLEEREKRKIEKRTEKKAEDKKEKREGKKAEKREEKKLDEREEKEDSKIDVKREEKQEEKSDILDPSERTKRNYEMNNLPSNVPLIETRNSDSKKRTLNDDIPNKRSVSETQDNSKRFIEVSFSSNENKDSMGGIGESDNSCPKPSVIPNKREANEPISEVKKNDGVTREKKEEVKEANEQLLATTESYEEYEQRIAREIKNKIKLLKEEVKRELGALESEKDEEDDDDTLGESQRKKRFIMNTLLDEESQNIDPNENLENSELEPHVRRRRFLSTDMMSFSPQNEKSNFPDLNYSPMSVVQNKFDFDVNTNFGEDAHSQDDAYSKSEITKKDVYHSKARTRKANDYSPYMPDNVGSRGYRWDESSIYRQMYSPDYQRRIANSKYSSPAFKRNSRNDGSSDVGNSNSDYDNEASNNQSDEEGEMNGNSVVDMTRKAADRKSELRLPSGVIEEHAPRKLQGHNQNQKYFYYYMGNNENDRRENIAQHSSKNQRASNSMFSNYRNQYPNQYYNSLNRASNKQYSNEAVHKRAFQRRFDKLYGRRRKRYADLMIPSHHEDAIVSNVPYQNTSHYKSYLVKVRNSKVEKVPFRMKKNRGVKKKWPDIENRNITSANGSWPMQNSVPPTEKGKNTSTTINFNQSGRKFVDPWNSPMEKYRNLISNSINENIAETANNYNPDHHNENLTETRKQIWKDYMNSFPNPNYYSDSLIAQNQKKDIFNIDQSKEELIYPEEHNHKSRKPLSWNEISNFTEFNSENMNAGPYSRAVQRTNYSGNNIKEINEDVDGEEYEENYYVEPSSTSSLLNVVEPIEITTIPCTRKPKRTTSRSPDAFRKVGMMNIIYRGKPSRTTQHNVDYLSSERRNLDDFLMNKNNLIVQNQSLPWADWRRRKRDLQAQRQPQYHANARRKRSWFWPTLSFLHNNAPQIDGDLELDQNESPIESQRASKRSSEKSSFSFEDDAGGEEEGEFDDFGDDPIGYERKKRDSGTRQFYPAEKSLYYYPYRSTRSSNLPISRNRRYIHREFREPQQQLLSEMSDAELFGALPQGYTGELTRYKRVKRAGRNTDKT